MEGFTIDEVSKMVGARRGQVNRFISSYDGILFNRDENGKEIFSWDAVRLIRENIKPMKERVVIKRVDSKRLVKTNRECAIFASEIFSLMSDFYLGKIKKPEVIMAIREFSKAKQK